MPGQLPGGFSNGATELHVKEEIASLHNLDRRAAGAGEPHLVDGHDDGAVGARHVLDRPAQRSMSTQLRREPSVWAHSPQIAQHEHIEVRTFGAGKRNRRSVQPAGTCQPPFPSL